MMEWSDIVQQVVVYPDSHVVITGGEPLLWPDVVPLATQLHALGKHITVETAGTLMIEMECDLMSISPKMSNSRPTLQQNTEWHTRHEVHRFRPDVVRQLIDRYEYQLKFVVESPSDLAEIESYLDHLGSVESERVLMMPQGIHVEDLDVKRVWLEPLCAQKGWVYCDRAHLRWFGNKRGT